jgi:hypothetical protein
MNESIQKNTVWTNAKPKDGAPPAPGASPVQAQPVGPARFSHSFASIPLHAPDRQVAEPDAVVQRTGDNWLIGRNLATPPRGVLHIEAGRVFGALLAQGLCLPSDIQGARNAVGFANMGALFSSVPRGQAIIRHYLAGLAAPTIRADGIACADDTLGDLLDLSFVIQQAPGNPLLVPSVVRQALLNAGYATLVIVNAVVTIPALLNTAPRASKLVDHLIAGGTVGDAGLAATFEPNNAVILGEALTRLRDLATIPGMNGLAQDKVNALLGERAHLTTLTLRTNAVNLTVAANDGQAAQGALQQHRGYGYRQDFKIGADLQAASDRNTLVVRRNQEVSAEAQNERNQATLVRHNEAFGLLTSNEQRILGGSAHAALTSPLPFLESSKEKFRQAKSKLERKRDQLVLPDILGIDQVEQGKLNQVANVEGPAEFARVSQQYQNYFANVNFHPDALTMLNAAGKDEVLAAHLINAIVAKPATRAIFVAGLAAAGNQRLLTLGADALSALLGAGVTVQAITTFASTDTRRNFLVLLAQAALVVIGQINLLAPCLGNLNTYLNDAASCQGLITLLATDTPQNIVLMLNAAVGPPVGKAPLLATVRNRAQSAADLIQVLQLCGRLGWAQSRIQSCLLGQPNNSAVAILVGAVHWNHFNLYNASEAYIGPWLNAVGVLITEGYVTIAANGAWVRLTGLPVTDHRDYNVERAADGHILGSFCVHYHPYATAADVSNPLASQSHFKQNQHADSAHNYYYNASPQEVRNYTQPRPS